MSRAPRAMMPDATTTQTRSANVRAVLFDLDGTLLDLDLGDFLRRYFAALEVASAPLANDDTPPSAIMAGMHRAVAAMMEPHPDVTNQVTFYEQMLLHTGIDLEKHWHVYESFYEEVFPTLQGAAGPARGARRAVGAAFDLGLGVAIATNPIFPRRAIELRLAWAGLDDLDLPVITSYETMRACKPHPAYFRQAASLVGVDPADCLMVGDDRALDMAAADVGMRTFYVGAEEDVACDMRGNLDDLTHWMARLL